MNGVKRRWVDILSRVEQRTSSVPSVPVLQAHPGLQEVRLLPVYERQNSAPQLSRFLVSPLGLCFRLSVATFFGSEAPERTDPLLDPPSEADP